MPNKKNIADILGQVRNPLVFFTLALLLIEGIIGMVVTKSTLTETHTFYSICIMAGLFLIVVGVVAWITIKWPKHLYEEIVQGIETSKDLKEFIESTSFRDTIEDILTQTVKSECLSINIQSTKKDKS